MYLYLFFFQFKMHKNRSFFLIPQDKPKVHLSGHVFWLWEEAGTQGQQWENMPLQEKGPRLSQESQVRNVLLWGNTKKNTLPCATIKEHAKKTPKPKYKQQQQQLNEHTLTFVWKIKMVFNGLIKRQLGNEFTFSEYLISPQNLIVWSRAWTFRDYRSIFTPMETIFGEGRGRLWTKMHLMSI